MSYDPAAGYEVVVYRTDDVRTDDSPRVEVDRVLCTRRALPEALATDG